MFRVKNEAKLIGTRPCVHLKQHFRHRKVKMSFTFSKPSVTVLQTPSLLVPVGWKTTNIIWVCCVVTIAVCIGNYATIFDK